MSLDELWVDVEDYLQSFRPDLDMRTEPLILLTNRLQAEMGHIAEIADKMDSYKNDTTKVEMVALQVLLIDHMSDVQILLIQMYRKFNIKPTSVKYFIQDRISNMAKDNKDIQQMDKEWKIWMKALRLRNKRKIKVIREDEKLGLKVQEKRRYKNVKEKEVSASDK